MVQEANEQDSGSTEGAARCVEEKASLRSMQGSSGAFEPGLRDESALAR